MAEMGIPHRRLSSGRAAGALTAGLALMALFGGGCSIERPSAPSTEFTVSIPVADDSTRISKVIGDRSDFLSADSLTRGMRVHFSRDVGRAEVGDRLRIRPVDTRFATPIGKFRLPGQRLPTIDLSLASLLPGLPVLGTVPIPSASIAARASIPLSNLRSVQIEEGRFELSIVNGLPVALAGLKLTLRDLNSDAIVDVMDLGTLAADGGASTGVFSLAGKDISGNLAIEVAGATVATSAATIGGNPSLIISGSMTDLVVAQATAFIPQQQFSDHQVVAFPDTRVLVTRAKIRQGGLKIAIRNDIPLVVEVDFSLDDLKTPGGQTNTFKLTGLTPGKVDTIRFDLTDNEFAPPNPEQMRLSFGVKTAASDQEVTLTSGGEVSVEVITEDLIFSQVSGRLNGVRLPMPDVEREVEFPAGLDNVKLAEASLDIYVTSAIAFLADVDLLISGTNKGGTRGQVALSERFERGSPATPGQHRLTASPDELVSFLNLLPSHLAIATAVRLGDGLEEESIAADQWVSVDSVVFRTSSRLTVAAATQIDPDPRDITFRDSQVRAKVGTNFRRARVITEVQNSLPLGVGVRLFVGRTPETVFTNPVVTIPPLSDPSKPVDDSFHADPADVDASGHSVGSRTTRMEVEVSRDDVLKFILEDRDPGKLWSGVRIYLPATEGAVEIRDTDFVNTVAGLKVDLLLDKNLVE